MNALDSGYFHDLLFLANKASAILFGEVVVVAPEESLTGRVEKHACKFGEKYVRRKNSKEHMDSTSTLIYNNAETHSKSEQIEAVDRQGRCSGVKNKSKGDDNQERRSLIPHLCGIKIQEIPGASALNQAVLGSDVPGGEMIVSESEDFIPLLDEAGVEEEKEKEKEKEKGVSNASRCNQWWNFKTRPRTSKGIRRHVRWSKKRKRNCMTFEETQSNRKILLLAVEAVTHQLGLLDVSMEEKSSHK
ncbi:hypothetical protein Bca52824_031455 [Brassica carinata]|uniref:Uncharacterized protein n=1 Tax=Brassica carinata TaxID=52824 RepID=A0A8X7V5B1_BRACI|nr:hypothetical protein Bca52824_031455 [Brassica carinata]